LLLLLLGLNMFLIPQLLVKIGINPSLYFGPI